MASSFLVPPQNVLLSGPSTIGTGPGHKVNFLCTSDVGNPAAKLSFRISEMLSTSSENDILGQLINEKVVELKESKERFIDRQRDVTETNYSRGTTGYITSQELVIHPRVVRKVRGNKMKIQCSSNEDISDAIVVELISRFKTYYVRKCRMEYIFKRVFNVLIIYFLILVIRKAHKC